MSTITDLIAAHDYKYGMPVIKNDLADTLIAINNRNRQERIDRENRLNDQQFARERADIEQKNAMDLLREKYRLEMENEIEKQRRKNEQMERSMKYAQDMLSGENKTEAGVIDKISDGQRADELQRKAKVIPHGKIIRSVEVKPIDGEVKVSLRTPTVQESKAMQDMQYAQEDRVKADQRSDVTKSFLEGDIPYESFAVSASALGIPQNDITAIVARRRTLDAQRKAAIDPVTLQPAARVASSGVAIPAGYRAKYGVNELGQTEVTGYEPIPPEERRFIQETQDRAAADKIKAENTKKFAQDTLDTINEITSGDRVSNFGLTGGLPSIPGSDRVTWEANINRLLSTKVLDVMKNLKEQSRTGSTGFGQLSNKELGLLYDASTALKRTMKPEEAKKILDKMRASLQTVINDTPGSEQVEFIPGAVYDDPVNGTQAIYVGGDPENPTSWREF